MSAQPNYSRMKGPGDLPGDPNHPNSPDYDSSYDEQREEWMAARMAEYAANKSKLRTAEEWVAGTFDGDHYTELTLALFALHNTDPDKLPGSPVLTSLYQLARTEHAAMAEQLRAMAEDEWNRQEAA